MCQKCQLTTVRTKGAVADFVRACRELAHIHACTSTCKCTVHGLACNFFESEYAFLTSFARCAVPVQFSKAMDEATEQKQPAILLSAIAIVRPYLDRNRIAEATQLVQDLEAEVALLRAIEDRDLAQIRSAIDGWSARNRHKFAQIRFS